MLEDGDDRSLAQDVDLEAGLGSSRAQLLHPFELERPDTVITSVKSTMRSTTRKICYYCSFVTRPIKKVLAFLQLPIAVTMYSVFGAWLFQTLEAPADLAAKLDAYHSRLIARETMILNLRAIAQDVRENHEERWKNSVLQFEQDLGLGEPDLDTVWTFWMSFLYAGTLSTTIGYGNIACQTRKGQVATLLYAFVGIPIMLVVLTELGDFLLKKMKQGSRLSTNLYIYIGVKLGMLSLEEGSPQYSRYQEFRKSLVQLGIFRSNSRASVPNSTHLDEDDGDEKPDPPVFSAIIVTFGWIFFSAAVFCLWEDWDYFTSVYFFFISCSTIGLGDVVPAHPEYMIFAFMVVMVGLALVTVCVNVIQEKIALMYMMLLQKLINDYLEATKNGDPNATTIMMNNFQGRAKFFMPLISKNQGAKVMNQIKEECAAKGIDPPAVLTNLDPETGMPAFASATKESFREYIEHAEEKQAEEQRLENEKRQLKAASPKPNMVVTSVQTISPPAVVEKHSFGLQYSSSGTDEECQTSDSESVDEGIQVWPSLEDVSIQYSSPSSDFECQFECPIQLPTVKMTGVAPIIQITSTAIQPEVSNFIFEDEDDLQSQISLESSFEDDFSDEETEGLLSVKDPSLQRLHKTVSEESQETVIHFPTLKNIPDVEQVEETEKIVKEEGETREQDESAAEEKRQRRMERRKRREEARRAAHQQAKSLRFMKSRGDQAGIDMVNQEAQYECLLVSTDTQYEVYTSENACQHEIETKGRRTQTKLTSMSTDIIPLSKMKKKRMVRRSSTMSSKTSSDQIQSTSSYDGILSSVSLPRPSLQSIDESESRRSSSLPVEGRRSSSLPAEEVELNVSLVARAVDERGEMVIDEDRRYLESPGQDITGYEDVTGVEFDDDEVFGSDIDIDEDELEHFTMNSFTQTDNLTFDDLQIQATVADLDIISDAYCQTELSAMQHTQSKQIKQAEGQTKETAQESSDVTRFLVPASAQTMKSGFYISDLQHEEEELSAQVAESSVGEFQHSASSECLTFIVDTSTQCTPDKNDMAIEAISNTASSGVLAVQEYLYKAIQWLPVVTEVSCQTISISDYGSNQGAQTKEAVISTYMQTDVGEYVDSTTSPVPPISVDFELQVIPDTTETSMFTEVSQIDTATQISIDHHSSETQTNVGSVNREQQYDIELQSYSYVQTENVENVDEELQTEQQPALRASVQTEGEDINTNSSIQVEREYQQISIQVHPPVLEAFTQHVPDVLEVSTQHELHMMETSTQHDQDIVEASTQHETELSTTSMQAQPNSCSAECQTERTTTSTAIPDEVVSTSTSGVDASKEYSSSTVQGEVSMFVVDQKDRSSLEVEHSVRFNVEVGTSTDMKRTKTMGTQSEMVLESSSVQAVPLAVNSHTQYVCEGIKEVWTQTDVVMKNKRSQSMSAVAPTEDTAVAMSSSDEEEPASNIPLSVLWSDFDPLVGENGEEEEGDAGSKERSTPVTPPLPENMREESIQATVLSTDAYFNATPVMEDGSVQAVTDVQHQASGLEDDSDDWVKVYVAELDEERRKRMFDIGIQAGVLARVQHMYGAETTSDTDPANVDVLKVSLRRTDSSEQLSVKSFRTGGSDESLAPHGSLTPFGSVRSVAESLEEKSSAGSSRPSTSFRKPRKTVSHTDREGLALRDSTVAGLRSKFEQKGKRPRSTSTER